MMKVAMIVIAGALVLAGCSTDTLVKRIDRNHFVVCDAGPSEGSGPGKVANAPDWGGCTGSNPEKGLTKTCFAVGRTIAGIKEISGNALSVTCGPPLAGKR